MNGIWFMMQLISFMMFLRHFLPCKYTDLRLECDANFLGDSPPVQVQHLATDPCNASVFCGCEISGTTWVPLGRCSKISPIYTKVTKKVIENDGAMARYMGFHRLLWQLRQISCIFWDRIPPVYIFHHHSRAQIHVHRYRWSSLSFLRVHVVLHWFTSQMFRVETSNRSLLHRRFLSNKIALNKNVEVARNGHRTSILSKPGFLRSRCSWRNIPFQLKFRSDFPRFFPQLCHLHLRHRSPSQTLMMESCWEKNTRPWFWDGNGSKVADESGQSEISRKYHGNVRKIHERSRKIKKYIYSLGNEISESRGYGNWWERPSWRLESEWPQWGEIGENISDMRGFLKWGVYP